MLTLPALARRIISTINMLLHIRRSQPRTSVFLKRLDPRLKLGRLQRKVVNRANARNAGARISGASTVHERSADTAEAVLHVVSRGNGVLLAEACELVFAANVLHVSVFDDEVGGEHAVERVSGGSESGM